MKISTKSWHYKLTRHFNFDADSLCLYFWQVVASIILSIFIAVIISFFIFIMFQPILFLFALHDSVFMLVSLCFWLAIIWAIYDEWRKNRPNFRKNAKPNIAVEYIKAAHSKVCPMLEFIDDD